MAEKSKFQLVDVPMIIVEDNDNPTSVLVKFYKGLGWNGDDLLNPQKVRTTREVIEGLGEVMQIEPATIQDVNISLLDIGPGNDEDIPSGKVKLLDGWVVPDESIAQG